VRERLLGYIICCVGTTGIIRQPRAYVYSGLTEERIRLNSVIKSLLRVGELAPGNIYFLCRILIKGFRFITPTPYL
jgi:hypothetical protein